MALSDADKEKMRNSLRNAGQSITSEDPQELFELMLIQRLKEQDVEINHQKFLRVQYPVDVDAGILLIEGQGTPGQQREAARMFAHQSGLTHRPYRARLRAYLKERNIQVAPAPADPEPAFEELLVKALQIQEVGITDRKQLVGLYPYSIENAITLMEGRGSADKHGDIAKGIAELSSLPITPYHAKIRSSLRRTGVPVPAAPQDPKPAFETRLVKALQENDVDINDRKFLRVQYPVDVDAGILLIEGQGTSGSQLDAARMFAHQSGRPMKTKTSQPNTPIVHNPAPNPAPIVLKPVAPIVIPRSATPSPIKLDRTVTAIKLLQINGGGKSNLETLGEQGKLADVFTDKIWIGRREEMDQVWEQVPERFRNQVNIEAVRGQLSQATVMDKFGIVKDKEWEHGF